MNDDASLLFRINFELIAVQYGLLQICEISYEFESILEI